MFLKRLVDNPLREDGESGQWIWILTRKYEQASSIHRIESSFLRNRWLISDH